MKSIASLFPKRERRKRHPAFQRMVTPMQALMASVAVLAAASWVLLTVQTGRPTSWFGDFMFLLCAQLSLVGAPSLCIATFMDLLRRGLDARLLVVFLVSLAAVAALSAFMYLRIHQYPTPNSGLVQQVAPAPHRPAPRLSTAAVI